MTNVFHSSAAWWRTLPRRVAPTDAGASLVEYALLLALITIVCIAAVSFLGNTTDESFSSVGSMFDTSG